MLPTEPPPRIARAIAWLLIAMFFTALAAAIFVHVPETVRCRLCSRRVMARIRSRRPTQAVVDEVRVLEGAEVPRARSFSFCARTKFASATRSSRRSVRSCARRKQAAIKLEAAYAAQIEHQERARSRRSSARSSFARTTPRRAGIWSGGWRSCERAAASPQIELTKHQLELAESEKDLNVSEETARPDSLDRRMETERARQRNEEATEVQGSSSCGSTPRNAIWSAAAICSRSAHPTTRSFSRSPSATLAASCNAGQELCQLARVDAIPHARLSLRERGLPRLAVGQRVRLFFDAFPYQRYGTIKGTLEWISPAAVTSPEGQMFVARGRRSIEHSFVVGEQRPLRVGMKGEARIVVGSRRADRIRLRARAPASREFAAMSGESGA